MICQDKESSVLLPVTRRELELPVSLNPLPITAAPRVEIVLSPPSTTQYKPTPDCCHFDCCAPHGISSPNHSLTRRAPARPIVRHRPCPFRHLQQSHTDQSIRWTTATYRFRATAPSVLQPCLSLSTSALSHPIQFSLGTLCISSSQPEVRLATKTTFWSSQINLIPPVTHSSMIIACLRITTPSPL